MSAASASSFALVGRDLARERGAFTVLDGVDVTVGPRTRLGVIGPNGVGKTTLLRLLAGVERSDRGAVTCTPPTLSVGYLPQEPDRSDEETLAEFLARRAGVAGAEQELAHLEQLLADLPGGVVLVSHDRAFLDHTVTRVLEIDEHTRRGTEYGSGWQGYLDARATARRHAEEQYEGYQTERARLEARART